MTKLDVALQKVDASGKVAEPFDAFWWSGRELMAEFRRSFQRTLPDLSWEARIPAPEARRFALAHPAIYSADRLSLDAQMDLYLQDAIEVVIHVSEW